MNNSSWLIPGSISLICGCMFSGKTDELIRRVRVLKRAQKKILIFKPQIDNRFQGKKEIITHDNLRLNSHLISTPADIKSVLMKQPDVNAVVIDEIQFLDKSFLPLIKKLAKEKKIVICAGMDKDYWNHYDSLMSRLLVEAEIVDKLFAICSKCNQIATHTQRMKDGAPVSYLKPKIMIGGSESYEARCKFCYVDFLE